MPNQNQLTDAGASRRFLPLLLLLFAGSGCSALVYEIVWYQLLQLVIGSTAVSLAVLLATFMGGLCLGSIALPRIRSLGGRHPLRVYALVELGIGVCGILVLFGMPLVDRVYVAAVGHGLPAMLLRAVVAAACLLPPTVLMGASLPAASRWLETSPEGVSWMSLLYGGNTAGAVFGCLLAGFYLLRVFDMATATLVAAAINGAGALIGFGLASRTPHPAGAEEQPTAPAAAEPAPRSWPIYVTIALSGACALGAEVVWTRLLGLLLGATVYTFSIILAVFLAGLGLGSGASPGRASLSAAANCCLPGPSHGPLTCWPTRCRIGPSIRCFPPAPGSRFRSTWRVRFGPFCRPRCFGAPVFPWRWRRWPRAAAMPDEWWAAFTRPTPPARLWAPLRSACFSFPPWARQGASA